MPTPLLQIENLTKSYGDRMLFADVTFGIAEGDKIGLIAKNGTGKTTMLRIIAGAESADSGSVIPRSDLRVGILEQHPHFEPDTTVKDEIRRLGERCGEHLAWQHEDTMQRLLTMMGIDDLNAEITSLSGGQQKRVALAALIASEPELLILDEPTNHLDLDVIEWLEGYLTRARITLLLVTHDRYFLDRICNKIIEIDNRRIFTYQGNYDYFLRRRAERIEAMENELAKVKNTLRRETEWMRRQPQARAGKARYRIDAYHDLVKRSKQGPEQERAMALDDMKSSYIGSKIAVAHNITKSYGEKCLVRDFSYTFARYEKVGIVGKNGVGKSTFIKIMMGLVKPDSGTWEIGETVRFGYYSQERVKLDGNKRVIDAVTDLADDVVLTTPDGTRRYTPMQFLNKFLFTAADQQKYVNKLSGGELCRLHLALVLMKCPNFLVLDEPTNDLDIVTLGLLEEYLRDFGGCLIVVSHDRFFLDQLVDHLFVMEGDGAIKDFPGTYSEYKQWLAKTRKPEPETDAPATKKRVRTERPAKMTYKERQEFEKITAELEALGSELAALDALFASGDTLTDVERHAARYEELRRIIDEKEMRWLELSEKE